MDKLEINLFGVFEARADGAPVRMPTRRVELILALLALDIDRAVSRSHLSSVIWPGQADAQARASLRQAIFRLRSALGASHESALDVTTGWLKLRRDSVILDADRLRPSAALSDVPKGLPLDGLSGFEPEIEDLLHARRAELRHRFVAWLERAQMTAAETRRFTELEQLARLHLSLDGYDEGALRMLMTALSRQGRRNAALEAFQDTSKRIRTELSVSVEPATLELFQTVRTATPVPAAEAAGSHVVAEQSPPPLRDVTPPTADAATETPAHLRHLAFMHVISERLAAALRDPDPENAEAQSRAALGAIEEAVKREGGKVVGRAGHHLSCVFGAERPDESPSLSAALAGFEIAGRNSAVALHAGPAMIGAGAESLPLAHVAQSLAEKTPSGTVQLTEPVELACRGAFALEKVPPVDAGAEARPVWRLSGEAMARDGFDIRKARGLSRFVGREAEMSALERALNSDGPRAVVVIGEPGIGKSRLLHEFVSNRSGTMLLRVRFTKGEAGGGIDRFAEPLFVLSGIRDTNATQDVLDVIASTLKEPALVARAMPPLAALLGRPGTAQAWIEASRGQKFPWLADALLMAIEAQCGRNAILVVEDAHWADEDARLLLDRLVRSLDGAGPMLAVSQRPGVADTWAGHGQVAVLTLRPLDDTCAAALLNSFHVPRSSVVSLLKRGGGIPLFLEELARLGPDVGASAGVPIALTNMLSHRIDALPPGPRRVIEAAAVIGSEPSDDLMTVMSNLHPEAYEAAVLALAEADLLFRIRSVPQRVYGFKHALLRDAAYQSIPSKRRQALHAEIVERLEPAWLEGDKTKGALLAGHAAKAGLARKAIDFAFVAAEDAVSACAFAFADRTLDIARKSLQTLEHNPEVRRLELRRLQLRLPVLVAYADAEKLQANLSEALALSRELGDDEIFAFLSLHAAFVFQHYDPARALEHADAARGIAEAIKDASLSRESAISRCQILSFQGKMREALAAIDDYATAWEDSRAERDEYLVSRFVMNQFLLTRSFAATGDAKRALKHAQRAVQAAVDNDHPIDRYIALLAVGDLFAFADRNDQAVAAFRCATEIARKQEHVFFEILAAVQLGKAELGTADVDSGVARLETLLGAADVDPVLRMEAEAALACRAGAQDVFGAKRLKGLLQSAEMLDLPLVRVSLLRALAKREPTASKKLLGEAAAIVEEQGYAICRLPEERIFASFTASA
ncbi:AAA family ATPase [uncultured Tateyamaria sp.]|uniref:AAA family ATPase n=1 Tax=uncultured Tateyamaria sp. TaxID=455651 RepID=UPI002604C55F|nr:AAA family ATPase [uncultured Tateyamaria sp.]